MRRLFAPADTARGLFLRLFGLTLVLLLTALGLISTIAIHRFERELLPEMRHKSVAVGASVAGQIERAVRLGIPFGQLVGMKPFLSGLLAANPDLEYLAVTDDRGRALYEAGRHFAKAAPQIAAHDVTMTAKGPASLTRLGTFYDTWMPIRLAQGRAQIHVGTNTGFMAAKLRAIVADVATVLLVSLLATFEFLMIVIELFAAAPLQGLERRLERAAEGDFATLVPEGANDEIGRFGRAFNRVIRRVNEWFQDLAFEAEEVRAALLDAAAAARVGALMDSLRARFAFARGKPQRAPVAPSLLRVRIPLFVFILSEELTRPFLPLYIKHLYVPVPGLSADMAIGLPISAFMLTIALLSPWAGAWTDRFGTRRVFLAGAAPGVIGFVGTALAGSLWSLMAWRAFCAAGYGIIYIACQGYIARHSGQTSRVRGMAVFMGAVFAAAICGPSIGGILVDRIGMRATLLVSAALVASAAAMIQLMLKDEDRPEALVRDVAPPAGLSLKSFTLLLRNRRFLALTTFVAIPAKIVLTGFLFYLAPIYLTALGQSQSSVGRVMMIYGLANVAVSPLTARLADRVGRLGLFVGGGALAAGLGVASVLWHQNAWGVTLAVAALGAAHAASISQQLTLVQEVCADEARLLGRTTVLSVFRLIERMGNVAGPFVAAFLMQRFGGAGAAAGIGAVVLAGALVFAALGGLTLGPALAPSPAKES